MLCICAIKICAVGREANTCIHTRGVLFIAVRNHWVRGSTLELVCSGAIAGLRLVGLLISFDRRDSCADRRGTLPRNLEGQGVDG